MTVPTAPTTGLCTVGTPTAVISDGSSFTWQCQGSNGGNTDGCFAFATSTTTTGTVGGGTATTRNYLNGIYVDPSDTSTPQMMGYPWDYTVNGSYQDPYAGAGVSGVQLSDGSYPVIIDLFTVDTGYTDFNAAANGDYNSYYQQTLQQVQQFASQIYGVRIDSEFNGNWEVWSVGNHRIPSADLHCRVH